MAVTLTSASPTSGNIQTIVTLAAIGGGFTVATVLSLQEAITGISYNLTTVFVDASHVHAAIPINIIQAGLYNVTATDGASHATLTRAYVGYRAFLPLNDMLDVQTLLDDMMPWFASAAKAAPALSITPIGGAGWLTIKEGHLTISDANGVSDYDLAAQVDNIDFRVSPSIQDYSPVIERARISDVVAWLQMLGYQPQMTDNTLYDRSALMLLPTSQNLALNSQLSVYTSLNWWAVGIFADLMGSAKTQSDAMMQQLDLHTASGHFLDLWGELFGGLPRDGSGLNTNPNVYPIEPDERYRRRLTLHIVYPWNTAASIQRMLNDGYGLSASMLDVHSGHFQIQYLSVPSGYTLAQLTALTRSVANHYKAAGVAYSIIVGSTIIVQDTLNLAITDVASLPSAPPPNPLEQAGDTLTIIMTENITVKPGIKPPDV